MSIAIGLGLGITFGGKPDTSPRIAITGTTLAEDATIGTAVGELSVVNGSGSYTFAIDADPDSKFALNGDGITLETDATLDYETATSHSVTISADNGVDDPIVRVFTISVTNVFEAATLAALTLDTDEVEETATTGTVVGTLQNVTSGSTLSLLDDAGGRFALDGSDIETTAVSLGAAGASYSITVRETLADSSNSPRDSVIGIDVVEEAVGSAAFLLAAGEDEAFSLVFADDFFYSGETLYGSAYVVDAETPANDFDAAPDGLRVSSTALVFDDAPPVHGASVTVPTMLRTDAFGSDAMTIIVTLHDGGTDYIAGVSLGGVGGTLTAWDGTSGASTPGGLSGAVIVKNTLILPRAMTEAQLEAATA